MKKIYLFLLVLVAVFVACKKDMDVEFSTFEVENEKISPSYISTELSCKVRCAATINELYLQYDTVADFATYQEVALTENEKTKVYSVKIGDLLDNTTYYVRYVAVNSYSQVTSEEVSEFKTLQATTPTIEVREITDVLDTIATVGFVLKFNGGADVTKMGVCWSVDSLPTIDSTHVVYSIDAEKGVADGDSLVLNISELKANTIYYVRAYAENKRGISYSESRSFITLTLPEVKTKDITDIQLTTAVLNGEALFDGNDSTTIYGFCWGEESNPTLEDNHIQVKEENFSYKLSNLKSKTTYHVRAFAKNKIGVVYGEEISFRTFEDKYIISVYSNDDSRGSVSGGGLFVEGSQVTLIATANLGYKFKEWNDGNTANPRVITVTKDAIYTAHFEAEKNLNAGHEYVDLGLSVKWATCNVGANAPEEYGDYFAWGETTPKENYDWTTYKYCKGTDETMTKYCNNSSYGNNGFTDNKTVLDPEDDAATANWGGAWRMPTTAEQNELREKCKWTWTTQNGVKGYKVIGPNGNSIFLPAAGFMDESTLYSAGSGGYYWSSSLYTDNPNYAYLVNFGSDYVGWRGSRYRGRSVRPVYGELSQQPETKLYTISVYSHDNLRGTVSGGGTYDEGCQVTITATANSGYRFKEWNDGNTDNPRVITVTKDAIYTAHFEEDLKQYTISVYSNDNSRGAVSGGGTYNEGSQVTITATANEGYKFKEWNDGNTDNPRVITVTKDAIYTAHFEEDLKQYTISVYSNDNSRGAVSGGGAYEEGSQVTLIATAKSGYKFKEWNDGNMDNPRVITVTKDAIYTAHFEEEKNLNVGYEYVDLGLSVKWATCNVGANSPEEYGDYFAWGEVNSKVKYSWNTYLFHKYDIAQKNLGGSWRMPTKQEQNELVEKCVWQKMINGYKVSGPNGNFIFLPYAGYMDGYNLCDEGSVGCYWSLSPHEEIADYAYYLEFILYDVEWSKGNFIYYGFSVRAVCP